MFELEFYNLNNYCVCLKGIKRGLSAAVIKKSAAQVCCI